MRAAAGRCPHFGIGADLIVGFPGETDAEFADTRRLVQELPFTYLHVFRFSPRPGTAAAAMPRPVHPEIVSRPQRSSCATWPRPASDGLRRGLRGHWREAVVEADTAPAGLAAGHHRQLRARAGAGGSGRRASARRHAWSR